MKTLHLTDRIVVEIKREKNEDLLWFIADRLEIIAAKIKDGCKGGTFEWGDEPDCPANTEVLWEHECHEYGGFKMGNRSLISDAYYGAKEYFEVCSVTKEDLEKQGFDAHALTDEDMEHIASKMNDLICEGCDYWSAVDGACEYWKVPKKEEEDDPRLTPQQRKELGYE